jgi:hypothetical protein
VRRILICLKTMAIFANLITVTVFWSKYETKKPADF